MCKCFASIQIISKMIKDGDVTLCSDVKMSHASGNKRCLALLSLLLYLPLAFHI